MSFNLFTKASRQNQSRFSFLLSRSFSHRSESSKHSFGIAFDIDGVILLGNTPVGGSPSALSRLYDAAGKLRIPYVFLTNGGGFPEAKRAFELSQLLGINISPSQVLQGHSPFKQLVNRFENEFIVAVGKGQPAAVMSEYGFKNVLSIDEYASLFENIDPLAPYKKWTTKLAAVQNAEFNEGAPRNDVFSERIKAAFIVSDPVDWSRDIQVLCDILKTGGLPGRNVGPQPHLYFANDDLEYQTAFPSERLGLGAFRIALESIFNRIHHHPLEYASFGKPHPSVFKNAEIVIQQLVPQIHGDPYNNAQNLKTLYMIGDNPVVDIRGARQTGHPWFSILTRTGVFKGKGNHDKFPADLVVDTVEEAVDYILTKECAS
ncbi:putative HAD-superfamily hydrolase, subfamily IIA [Lupinus albus]|uniref:Putative HAD-superfamily hydrolase, subfamily IIA n=1 Tax=Lupinus albus TaxID=3870 RepID=A0A6A4N662_LUPAL|nr:putative HAD-superfamily hydrolase, subfamily IIA [Lupinus albus]